MSEMIQLDLQYKEKGNNVCYNPGIPIAETTAVGLGWLNRPIGYDLYEQATKCK